MSNTRWVVVSFSVFLSLLHGPLSQRSAPAPPPALDCTGAMMNLSACLTYAEAGSNLTRPGKGCCRGLASVVDTEPVCLCQLICDNDVFGVEIDTTKALALPTACRVDAPPATLCAVLGAPIASPSPSSGDPEEPGMAEVFFFLYVDILEFMLESPAGSSSSLETETPATAPPNSHNSSSRYGTTGLAFLILLSFVDVILASLHA
ncbi:non-specific lipid transfer protein GPI-anchored 12-like isoform X1 [Musa acuminata AAA Group]|uniref:non-specific lipid transfer protein GPI-anchored 12-like isoform X1 n=1 Tax=Musa acuminata AAA Group TaxID=214697 RepID=UPI0031CF465B